MLSDVGRSDTPGQRILNVLDTFLRGGRISEAQVAGAINDAAAWVIGGGVAGGFYPNVGGPARPEDFRRGRPPPPPDPVDHELLHARAKARQALGFAANEVLTVDQVKSRQRKLARRTHPDFFPEGPKRRAAQERMIQINAAADVLVEELSPPKG